LGLFGVVVVATGVTLGLGARELFEEVGILNGGGDLVVAGGPLAEIEEAAALGAEGKVLAGGENDFATSGAEECFRGSHVNLQIVVHI
jgi:hypothetical protein